ncbi:MAG: quinone-dependent dihydroorotate dehydrogenase [Bacteroidota bacterium]|nr:quinone-dependent dihydroorotate dehydrogenase [Bacteroidota bacterium]
MYKTIIRPFLFLFKPETAHYLTFFLLKLINAIPVGNAWVSKIVTKPKKRTSVFGIDFPNPVGLAAGLDKEAEAFDTLGAMGFGFVEIGTLTPKAQPGNPSPRLFRVIKDKALINRMGFNNKGVQSAVSNLRKKKTNIIVGGNIGKNKGTPNNKAVEDYTKNFNALFDYVDYFAINLSSPNTPNLRELQEKDALKKILSSLVNLNNHKAKRKPLLLKIAPDLSEEQLDDIISIVTDLKIDGIIAVNTTISRNNLSLPNIKIEAIGAGGLSGMPLRERSTEIIRYITKKTQGEIPIIASGGIMSAEDAKEKIDAGASLIQLYTGFIYEGPALIKKIVKAL